MIKLLTVRIKFKHETTVMSTNRQDVFQQFVTLKQLTSRCLKIKKIIKVTVNAGQVMFSGESYYY